MNKGVIIMEKHIKTLALVATGLVVAVVLGRVKKRITCYRCIKSENC